MMEDFEASLQVLRGFDTDITAEVNEIKVSISINVQNQHINMFDSLHTVPVLACVRPFIL